MLLVCTSIIYSACIVRSASTSDQLRTDDLFPYLAATGHPTDLSISDATLPSASTLPKMKVSNSTAAPLILRVPVRRAASWSPSRRNSWLVGALSTGTTERSQAGPAWRGGGGGGYSHDGLPLGGDGALLLDVLDVGGVVPLLAVGDLIEARGHGGLHERLCVGGRASQAQLDGALEALAGGSVFRHGFVGGR